MDDLISLERRLRTLNFSVVDARTQAIEQVRDVRVMEPADLNRRFSDRLIYVKCSPELRTILTNIVSALSYRDLQKDPSKITHRVAATGEDVRDQVVGASVQDSTRSFYKNVHELGNYLFIGDNLYDRERFERENGDWHPPPAAAAAAVQQQPAAAGAP